MIIHRSYFNPAEFHIIPLNSDGISYFKEGDIYIGEKYGKRYREKEKEGKRYRKETQGKIQRERDAGKETPGKDIGKGTQGKKLRTKHRGGDRGGIEEDR
jgi:hypothetical protein